MVRCNACGATDISKRVGSCGHTLALAQLRAQERRARATEPPKDMCPTCGKHKGELVDPPYNQGLLDAYVAQHLTMAGHPLTPKNMATFRVIFLTYVTNTFDAKAHEGVFDSSSIDLLKLFLHGVPLPSSPSLPSFSARSPQEHWSAILNKEVGIYINPDTEEPFSVSPIQRTALFGMRSVFLLPHPDPARAVGSPGYWGGQASVLATNEDRLYQFSLLATYLLIRPYPGYALRPLLWWMLHHGHPEFLTRIIQYWIPTSRKFHGRMFNSPIPDRCKSRDNWNIILSSIKDDYELAWRAICNFVRPNTQVCYNRPYEKNSGVKVVELGHPLPVGEDFVVKILEDKADDYWDYMLKSLFDSSPQDRSLEEMALFVTHSMLVKPAPLFGTGSKKLELDAVFVHRLARGCYPQRPSSRPEYSMPGSLTHLTLWRALVEWENSLWGVETVTEEQPAPPLDIDFTYRTRNGSPLKELCLLWPEPREPAKEFPIVNAKRIDHRLCDCNGASANAYDNRAITGLRGHKASRSLVDRCDEHDAASLCPVALKPPEIDPGLLPDNEMPPENSMLKPGRMINDEIMQGYIDILQDHLKVHKCENSNVYVFSQLGMAVGKDTKSFAKRVPDLIRNVPGDVLKRKFILFPLLIGGAHFVLGVAEISKKRIYVIDSWEETWTKSRLNEVARMKEVVRQLKIRADEDSDMTTWKIDEIPLVLVDSKGKRYHKQQEGSNDCGLFVLRAIECLAYGIDLKIPIDMNNYRRYVDYVLRYKCIPCTV